jgi:phospholipase C
MKISKLILLASLLVATEAAQAGKPVLGTVIESDHVYPWEKQRIRATEAVESGDATKAFNFLQDQFGKPRVDEVWYDFDSDFYHWRGPATGNRMAMTREKFEKEIPYPYYEVKTDEQK